LYVGDQDAVLHEVESFISSASGTTDVDHVLATVLYVTAKSSGENNKATLQRFPTLAKREADWFKGRVSESKEHKMFATFDGPIRAIKCARAIRESALEVGIETKAGLHTGLCEMRGDFASGNAVEISKEVANRAAPNEVLLTNTVMDLVSGSGVVFSNRGSYSSERLSENCQLFATV
jgi:class 3 adenylate cyclase